MAFDGANAYKIHTVCTQNYAREFFLRKKEASVPVNAKFHEVRDASVTNII